MGEKKRFLLRIDSDLWDELQVWAADDLRSVNGQIEYLLKQAANARRRTSRAARDEGSQEQPPGT